MITLLQYRISAALWHTVDSNYKLCSFIAFLFNANIFQNLLFLFMLINYLFNYFILFFYLGVFVYPLGEKEVVVGFEAVIAGRLVGVQIQSRGKLKDCCFDCCPGSGLEGNCGNGREWGCCGSSNLDMQCTNGERRRVEECGEGEDLMLMCTYIYLTWFHKL